MNEPTVGQIVEGVVVRIEPYGVWIDHEGRPGLVTIPEVSWRRIRHPGEVVSVGDRVRAVVLGTGDGPFRASMKAAAPDEDPWHDRDSFRPGTTFDARVVRRLDYGWLVELRPDLEAILRTGPDSEDLREGARCLVTVASLDEARRAITVSLKPPDTSANLEARP